MYGNHFTCSLFFLFCFFSFLLFLRALHIMLIYLFIFHTIKFVYRLIAVIYLFLFGVKWKWSFNVEFCVQGGAGSDITRSLAGGGRGSRSLQSSTVYRAMAPSRMASHLSPPMAYSTYTYGVRYNGMPRIPSLRHHNYITLYN